ncbi:hypothetical protein [Ekhidna sp.]|uniref:hypothetical protein n=1 Tax=Ekhidna sp. TaxID=2608089 RepID=UPI003BAD6612
MISRTLCLIISSLALINVYSQDILKDKSKNTGLYGNFSSFRKNSPSSLGEIEFIKRKNGSVKSLFINGDSIKNKKIIKDYWGFCKDDTIYFNVYAPWNTMNEERTPLNPYAIIFQKGYYFIAAVNTVDSTTPAVIGGLAAGALGGLVGGLIAMAEASGKGDIDDAASALNNPTNRLIVINHQTGQPKIANMISLPFLIGNDKDLLTQLNQELATSKVRKHEELKFVFRYLSLYNERNSDSLIFNEKEFWPEVTLVRKAKKQASESIRVYSGDNYLGELTNQTFVKEKVAPGPDTKLRFETIVDGDTIQSIQQLNLFQKEKKYFIVSHNIKSPSNIDIDESDATRTKYAIQALRK